LGYSEDECCGPQQIFGYGTFFSEDEKMNARARPFYQTDASFAVQAQRPELATAVSTVWLAMMDCTSGYQQRSLCCSSSQISKWRYVLWRVRGCMCAMQ
jgi:hypothetical protein